MKIDMYTAKNDALEKRSCFLSTGFMGNLLVSNFLLVFDWITCFTHIVQACSGLGA